MTWLKINSEAYGIKLYKASFASVANLINIAVSRGN